MVPHRFSTLSKLGVFALTPLLMAAPGCGNLAVSGGTLRFPARVAEAEVQTPDPDHQGEVLFRAEAIAVVGKGAGSPGLFTADHGRFGLGETIGAQVLLSQPLCASAKDLGWPVDEFGQGCGYRAVVSVDEYEVAVQDGSFELRHAGQRWMQFPLPVLAGVPNADDGRSLAIAEALRDPESTVTVTVYPRRGPRGPKSTVGPTPVASGHFHLSSDGAARTTFLARFRGVQDGVTFEDAEARTQIMSFWDRTCERDCDDIRAVVTHQNSWTYRRGDTGIVVGRSVDATVVYGRRDGRQCWAWTANWRGAALGGGTFGSLQPYLALSGRQVPCATPPSP